MLVAPRTLYFSPSREAEGRAASSIGIPCRRASVLLKGKKKEENETNRTVVTSLMPRVRSIL